MAWTPVLVGVGMFVSAIGFDYADASHTRAVTTGRPHAAAGWSLLMYLLGTFGLFSVLEVSYWLVLPEAAGLYVGTMLAVRPEPGAGTATREVRTLRERPRAARRRSREGRDRHFHPSCAARARSRQTHPRNFA